MHWRDPLRGGIEGSLEEMCFKRLFKYCMWIREKTLELSSVMLPAPSLYVTSRLSVANLWSALCNRAEHIYFFPVVCSFFFPRLISAVGYWMSAILPDMVWP